MTLAKFYLLLIPLLLALACGALSNDAAAPAEVRVVPVSDDTLITKRYAEVGGLWAREYELVMSGTGEVTFRGKIGVRELGSPERWRVPREDVGRVVEAFVQAGFFDLADEYGRAFDNVSTHDRVSAVAVVTGGRSKTVSRHLNEGRPLTPEERTIRDLETMIVKVAGAESRIRETCSLEGAEDVP